MRVYREVLVNIDWIILKFTVVDVMSILKYLEIMFLFYNITVSIYFIRDCITQVTIVSHPITEARSMD